MKRNEDATNQFSDETLASLNWKRPACYEFKTLSELKEKTSLLNPFECKGFVATNPATAERLQILNKLYVSVAYGGDLTTIGSLNLDGDIDYVHMFDICKNGVAWKMILYWPEWAHYAAEVGSDYAEFVEEIDRQFNAAKHLSEGEYAAAANKLPFSTTLFRMRQHGHVTCKEHLALMAAHHRAFAKQWKDFQARKKLKPSASPATLPSAPQGH